ncbi:MAG: hypothetical protein DHS20C19_15680 [Acidimicrobiales bacterium]|nr:MAG: hypothetical protein DHS20C19_15680 [Acidimicrobiales bacterium]
MHHRPNNCRTIVGSRSTPLRLAAVAAATLVLVGCGDDGDNADGASHTPVAATAAPLQADAIQLAVVRSIDLVDVSLSPDGRIVVGLDEEPDEADDSIRAWCALELASDSRSCVRGNIVEIGGLATGLPAAWSPTQELVAFTTLGDVYVYDIEAERVSVVTDDGFVDSSPDGIGNTDRDSPPAWSGDQTLTLLRSGVSNDYWTSLIDVTLDGEVLSSVGSPSYERTFNDQVSTRYEWDRHWQEPLVLRDGRVVVTGEGKLHVIDAARDRVDVLGDFTGAFAPYAAEHEEYGVTVPGLPGLPAVGELSDGRFLLYNDGTRSIVQTGAQSGGPSSLFVYEPRSDTLTPIFESSPREDGWVGPVAHALSPDGRLLFVAWRDPRTTTPHGTARTSFSVIDIEEFDQPVVPHELTVLHSTDEFVLAIHPLTWATNNHIAVNYVGTGGELLELRALELSQDGE